jgi:hypothetical protein
MESLSLQVDLVVDVGAGVGQPPKLDLAGTDVDGGIHLAVDRAVGWRADVQVTGLDGVALDLEVTCPA